MATPAARVGRPNNNALLAVMAVLAGIGLYTMRIATAQNDVPVGFLDAAASGTLPNGVALKKHYTGLRILDEGLSFLVTAFLYGPTGWSETFYWQQLHFLFQITPVLAVHGVEAYRGRNQNSWIKYISIWAFIYQNVGGAMIITLWWLAFHRISSPKSYFQTGRTVPLPYARAILPGILLFYVIPTIALFVPGLNLDTMQNLLAFWQFTPIFANIPLWFVSLSGSSTAITTKNKSADIRSLKILYAFAFAVSTAAHWFAIRGISLSDNPDVTYARVFIPSTYTWKNGLDWGVLFIFQWDWLIIGSTYIISSWVAICDVQRMKNGEATLENIFESFLVIAAVTVMGGPGATLAAVWFWREGKMAEIENASGERKMQ
ncbi:hypothetical protein ACET3X_008558 [Alternaria dauci]|uniref:Uncharacterized protein n=1 Tax=Alternaria dauci TaxID=48095 RepID=A0ABR3UAQ2_9PLEO